MNPYILLWLEAPLQSWGHDSKFGRRDSLPFPTKSGVLGLICCAMGAGGEQKELLAQFSNLSQSVRGHVREKQGRRELLLRDFHMVGSGYSDDPWQQMQVPKKSDGGKAVGGGSKLTYRYYIQDMAFAVVIQIPLELKEILIEKLQNPEWDIYLGRKNCVPTEFIFQGLYQSEEEAFQKAQELSANKKMKDVFTVKDGSHSGEVLTINDVPTQFGVMKKYQERIVTVISS